MAGDWIKMRCNLWDDPRVARLCDLTDCGEAAIVGGLYWLWSAADQHSEDGLMPGLTRKSIDRKTGIQGFGDALEVIGWVSFTDDGARIVRFDEHNGKSAKRRCSEAVRKMSARHADKSETSAGQNPEEPQQSCAPREEKRREEVNLKPHSEERGEVNGTTAAQNPPPPPSRKGIVCGLLRKAGMADAAPHYLPDDAWEAILAKRTDEEIVELARAKMAANPGRRIGLKYIAPALLEDPQRIEANARDSPAGRRKTLTETRTATIAGLTGGRTTTPKEQQRESIESTAVRIAG